MTLSLLALLLAQFATGPAPSGSYDGRCVYPETVRNRGEGALLVTCNMVSIGGSTISFGERDWGPRATFSGKFEGDVMTVSQVALHDGTVVEATGTCQLFYANERLSTVACLATSRLHQAYAANIVISYI